MSVLTKPAASTAATTSFCAAKIEGPGGHLWIDGNGKITRENGTLADPRPNAFSLVQVEDCPGSTPTCRAACYVHGLEQAVPDTHAMYRHNSRMIRDILARERTAEAWAQIVADWAATNCQGGFRWHVSGDVFSYVYACWIKRVCELAPFVPFWIYTRSFQFVPKLYEVSSAQGGNLALNLSCDRDNWDAAHALSADTATGLRLCYLTTDGAVPPGLPADSVLFPDYRLRGGAPEGAAWFDALRPSYKRMVCPVDYHGKSEARRCGPCDRCLT